jgi:chitin synthase
MSKGIGSNNTSLSLSKLESITDLSLLPAIADDVIINCLRERFLHDQTYTNVGSFAIAAVNPHKYVSTNADSVMLQYASEYRDTAERSTLLPPHIFQLANNAYYHMRRTSQDQSILLRSVIISVSHPP